MQKLNIDEIGSSFLCYQAALLSVCGPTLRCAYPPPKVGKRRDLGRNGFGLQ